MNPLYMISTPVNLRELRRLSVVRGFALDEGRALHHILSETFGKGTLSVFRLMPGRNGSAQATLYAYSTMPDVELLETARSCAPPEYISLLGIQNLKSKSMPEMWTKDKRLAFDVRVRPVRRLLKPLHGWSHAANRKEQAPFRKGAEVDAFLVAALRNHPDGPPADFNTRQFRAETYVAWLTERLAPGAKLEKAKIASADRKPAMRSDSVSQGPDVIVHGELSITDPERFSHLLQSGIGRHTAYGYGMLLLRPAGQ